MTLENLLAIRGSEGPHLAFAGHVDVVPPGQGWTIGPFDGESAHGLLYGRGAVDMKGAIAAFVAAAEEVGVQGVQSLLITGGSPAAAM